MYRPPYYISRGMRIGIMITLIVLFFVISPLLILYTAGYRYDSEQSVILTTGVLSIDVEPRDANVYINDVYIPERPPLRQLNLAPQTSYNVRITREDYLPWEKDIFIGSNQTAYIKDVTLFTSAQPTRLLSDVDVLTISPDGAYAITYTEDSIGRQLFSYNMERAEQHPIVRIPVNSAEELSWSPTGHLLLVHWSSAAGTEYLLVDAKDPTASRRFTRTAPIDLSQIQWFEGRQSGLYARSDAQIEQWLPDTQSILFTSTSTAWYVDDAQRLWSVQDAGIVGPQDQRVPVHADIASILFASPNVIITKTAQQETVISTRKDDTWQQTTLAINSLLFDPKRKEWIGYSQWELWRIGVDGQTVLLNRTGAAIQSVLPLDETGILLLVHDDMLEAFNPNYYLTHVLLPDTIVNEVRVIPTDRILLFRGTVAGVSGMWQKMY